MKLLIVGSDKVYAIENFYVKHIRQMGIEITQFPAQSYFYDYYQSAFLHKIYFKLGFSSILKRINREFKELVQKCNPDAIWIFKGMEIFPESLKWAKRRGIRLINYNPDNPFLFSNKGSGNRYITQSLGLYDLHLTYNLGIKKQLEEQMHAKTGWLPFGYEISTELFEATRIQPELIKACFLGNPDKERAGFIHELLAGGVQIDLYGNNWSSFITHPNATVHNAVYATEYWQTLRRYRVQLNLMRIHNPVSHNMRSFEIPGIGGIALMPDTPEHRIFFNETDEAFFFRNTADCIEIIQRLLRMPEQEAAAIRTRARARSEHSGYSYKDRAYQAIEFIRQLHA